MSINHNWFNGHNAGWVWALLRRERQQAEAAIEDCRELCRWGLSEMKQMLNRPGRFLLLPSATTLPTPGTPGCHPLQPCGV